MNYSRLIDLIPQFESVQSFGEIIVNTLEDGSTQMPYYVLDKIASQFVVIMYEDDLVINFNWPEWEHGRLLLELGCFEGLDSETLMKLLTVIVRADRFNEGFLVANFTNENVQKIIDALRSNSI